VGIGVTVGTKGVSLGLGAVGGMGVSVGFGTIGAPQPVNCTMLMNKAQNNKLLALTNLYLIRLFSPFIYHFHLILFTSQH
jgi:hypothetical protein